MTKEQRKIKELIAQVEDLTKKLEDTKYPAFSSFRQNSAAALSRGALSAQHRTPAAQGHTLPAASFAP